METTPSPPRVERRTRLQHHNLVRIAAHAHRSETSVAKVYAGGPVRATTYESVVAAATALGLPLPYPPKITRNKR
jgi:hypothetical protein